MTYTDLQSLPKLVMVAQHTKEWKTETKAGEGEDEDDSGGND